MSNLIALLSWHDEHPDWLKTLVGSLARARINRLVAVDGRYAMYPNIVGDHTPGSQRQALVASCADAGIRLTLHTEAVWYGNEIDKRSFLFRLAEQVSTPQDWYWVIDADERITTFPNTAREKLATSAFDVADVTLDEPHPDGTIKSFAFPMLFRALRGLTVKGNHYTYQDPQGRNLWGNAAHAPLVPRLDLTEIHVEHLTHMRDPDRRQAALTYYQDRDDARIETTVAPRTAPQPIKPSPMQGETKHRVRAA